MSLPEVHGYAIVSDDDRIADAGGVMPAELRNEADWAYFQAELDRADLVALGRVSHEATPNAKGRRRMVISRGANGLERRADAWWWNPETIPWADAAGRLLPRGGRVATPGGQGAFDIFRDLGFAGFHLSRARGVSLAGGRGLFAACERGVSAAEVLRSAGLSEGETVEIDALAGVTLTVWRARRGFPGAAIA